MFSKLKFDMLIVDESSSFKNHQAKRFKALMKIRPRVKRVVLLSATPAANNLIDLWSQFKLLDLGQRLGRFIGQYRADYFVPDKRNGQVVFSYKPLPHAERNIYGKIADITISMKSTDHIQMPELVTAEYPVRLSDKERERYDELRRDLVLKLSGDEVTAANAAALSGKLCQIANGAVYGDDGEVHHIHDRKLDALEDLIEAANGKPVLIAYWFRHDLERILERFPAEKLDSADSIRRWNDGEIPVAVIHPASAGHGLNLQAGGSTLVWFGLTWSLELYLQTGARLWRQGQKDTVVIHHIIAKGTIDEQVMAALKRKDKTQTALIEAVKANL
jgi:SNF2 family DNA or RNA helicase